MADRNGYIGRAPGDSSVTIARQTNTAAGSETTFVFNSGYDVGYLDVYLNGSKLINANDYTAADGQNVILTTAASAGDVLEFVAYKAFNVANPITDTVSLEVSGNLTAESATITNNLSVGGDLSVTGSISGEGSAITGIVTSLTAGNNISLSGSTGNVTITGLANTSNVNSDTLNVIGLSTFRNTVLVNGSTKLDFFSSTGQEGQIYATDEYLYINSSADNGVYLQTNGFIELKEASGSDKYIECNSHPNHNGEVSLYYNTVKKLETTNTGVTVTEGLAVNGSGTTKLELQQGGTPFAKFEFDGNHVNLGNLYSNGDTVFFAGNAERMKIDSTGDLIFNTTASTVSIDSGGGTTTWGPYDQSSTDGFGAKLDMAANGGNFRVQCTEAASQFTSMWSGYKGVNNTSYIVANGNAFFKGTVLVNTTSNNTVADPGIKLIASDTAASVNTVINTSNANDTFSHIYNTNATNNGYRFYVASTGGIFNYSGSNNNLSDEREKKNIVSLESKWDKVKAWELKKFHYNDEPDTDYLKYGVIAQQVEPICPEVIADWKKDEGVIRKGVKEQQMTWMAIKALQEAMERIETLEAEVAALKDPK